VADHVFAVAMLSMLVVDTHFAELEREKVLRMALLHDLGEVYAGDITPADGVTREEKHRLEEAAIHRLLTDLEGGDAYLALWEEYETGVTPEARLVRQVDRLEMALQAVVYERRTGVDLGEFLASTAEDLTSSVLVDLLEALWHLRGEGETDTVWQSIGDAGPRAKE
jgi:putative hydrolase of HD superfamily